MWLLQARVVVGALLYTVLLRPGQDRCYHLHQIFPRHLGVNIQYSRCGNGRELNTFIWGWGIYGLDLTVIHNSSIHIPVDKLQHMANPNFNGGWEM